MRLILIQIYIKVIALLKSGHFSLVLHATDISLIAEHKERHIKLLDQIRSLEVRIENCIDSAVTEELLEFLTSWLSKHIKMSDKEYGQMIGAAISAQKATSQGGSSTSLELF